MIIAGGGIGGLALAVDLARRGRRVLVLEKSARFREFGAGIQLGPNAFHTFDALKCRNAMGQVKMSISSITR